MRMAEVDMLGTGEFLAASNRNGERQEDNEEPNA